MREDYYQKWGEYFHPQSWQDFEMSNQEIFEKHLEKYHDSSDKVLKIKLYIDFVLNNIQYFGYYFAFCEGSFERLNNALLQTGRTCLLRRCRFKPRTCRHLKHICVIAPNSRKQ